MHVNQPLISKERLSTVIQTSTDHSEYYYKEVLKQAEEAKEDSRRRARLDKFECKLCYYIKSTRVGGQALTTSVCTICGKETRFSSTCVDKVCKECAAKYDVCVRCMSDLNYKQRRRK